MIDPIFNKTDMDLVDCLIHGQNQVMIAGDGGTGCDCGGHEHDVGITLIHAILIDGLDLPVKGPKNFCKRCGKDHKTSFCK